METLNGYTVIAQRPIGDGNLRHGERIILAVRDLSPAYTGYEYVVARSAAREESPREWHAGHYMRDSLAPGAAPAILRAVRLFETREA